MYTRHVSSSNRGSCRDFSNRTRLSNLLSALAVVCLTLQSTGCISGLNNTYFDDNIGRYRNHVWANRAYNLRYGNCDREFPEHFKEGFVDGYCDMCNGGDGYVPAVPPEKYWSFKFQSPVGAKCVNTWFKAYPLGVKAAREDSAGAFHKVYISKMIQSAVVQKDADHVLPDDVPVVTSESQSTGNRSLDVEAEDSDFEAGDEGQRTAELSNQSISGR